MSNMIMLATLVAFQSVSIAFSQAPTIATQPTNCYTTAGGSCTLSVVAGGEGLSYQWYHGQSGDKSTPSTTAGYNTCCHTLFNIKQGSPVTRWVQITNTSGFVDSISASAEVGTAPAPTKPPAYNGPAYSHVVIVMDENHDYGQIIGNVSNAPYINGTLVAGGANFTDYNAITHPSQPNYFAVYSGSTHNVTDDNTYSEPDPTLYTVLHAAGRSFTGYIETGSPRKHNPWESFPEGSSVESNVSAFPVSASGFSNLPNVSWVVPNLQDDMHDGTILQGDTWLKTHLDAYAQWAKVNNSLLILTFDEGTGSGVGVPSVIPTILYGAGVNHGNYGDAYNDYSTLATVLSAFGLESSAPNSGATATPINGVVFTATQPCESK